MSTIDLSNRCDCLANLKINQIYSQIYKIYLVLDMINFSLNSLSFHSDRMLLKLKIKKGDIQIIRDNLKWEGGRHILNLCDFSDLSKKASKGNNLLYIYMIYR
jgi:hypothetical protein